MKFLSHPPSDHMNYGSHPPAAHMEYGSQPPAARMEYGGQTPAAQIEYGSHLEPEPAQEYSFPRLQQTTMDQMSDFLPKLQVMGMLLSGSLGCFHAGLSCMSAFLGMLFFLHHFRQRQFLPDSLHLLNADHYKGLGVADTGQVSLFNDVSCFAFASLDVGVLLCHCILQRSLLHQRHGYGEVLLLLSALLDLAMTDTSMRAAVDLSASSPTTEAGTKSGILPDMTVEGGDAVQDFEPAFWSDQIKGMPLSCFF